MAKKTFNSIIRDAINDVADHGYDKAERMEKWLAAIRKAAASALPSEKQMQQMLRDALIARYRRLIDSGEIARLNPGVSKFTIKSLTPKMQDELTKRIMASANLIRLNRARAIDSTLQRFAGWMSSIPAGGTDQAKKQKTKDDISKSLSSLPYDDRRVLIDQGHKLASSINEVIANNGGAIAGEWVSHYLQPGYDFREEHADRSGKIFLIRGSWADKAGLVKPGPAGYTDSVTKPAEEPFCLPGDVTIDRFEDTRKIYRRPYDGPMVITSTASGAVLRTTPNHPILTSKGWVAAGLLQEGDDVIEICVEGVIAPKLNGDETKTCFSDLFQSMMEVWPSNERRHGLPMHFHGDGSYDYIDIVSLNRPLLLDEKPSLGNGVCQHFLTIANFLTSGVGATFKRLYSFIFTSNGVMSLIPSCGAMPFNSFSKAAIISSIQSIHNGRARYTERFREFTRCFSSDVPKQDVGSINYNFFDMASAWPEINDAINVPLPQSHGADTNSLSYLFEGKPASTKKVNVINVDRYHFSGHVYNLETDSGWFVGNSVIVSNCRCYYRYIYSLSSLPADMLTAKGKAKLAEARAKLSG